MRMFRRYFKRWLVFLYDGIGFEKELLDSSNLYHAMPRYALNNLVSYIVCSIHG